ncbi:MAG: putative toxin-antitoxin system toxin component, PIN family [Caldilinea sp.]|jgi:putative PIN family toxin of toxin-antitoxin system
MRIVLDTNVLISALISAKGAPAQVFDRWQAGELELVAAQEVLDELQRVLTYPRVRSRLRYSNEQIEHSIWRA